MSRAGRTDGVSGVTDHPELRWYFCEAGELLGPAAFDLEAACAARNGCRGSVGAMVRVADFHPSARELYAARRVSEIRAVLRELGPELRSVIETAYATRQHAPEALSRWGRAAGVVAAAERAAAALELDPDKTVTRCVTLLRAAHEIVAEGLRRQRDSALAARHRARLEAEARREELLERERERERMKPKKRALALLTPAPRKSATRLRAQVWLAETRARASAAGQ
ncbi:MAG: hypothetical protein IT373_11960 [Polyangiaceae bacterium]|nr:hypothetical protein [Polyangiaceae bacterium]